jgi:hypothetical protein
MSNQTDCRVFDPAATYTPPATVTQAQVIAACEHLGIDAAEVRCLVIDPGYIQLETKAGPAYVRVVP